MKISRKYPWTLWTESICLSFNDTPVFPDLSKDSDWVIEIEFSYSNITNVVKDIFALLPTYMGFSICEDKVFLGITYLDKYDWIPTDFALKPEVKNIVTFDHKAEDSLKVLLNSEEIFFTELSKNTLKIDPKSGIVLGSNTFTVTEEKEDYEIEIFDFKIFIKDKLVVHHDFSSIIYGKAVDLTGNYNFLYQLG